MAVSENYRYEPRARTESDSQQSGVVGGREGGREGEGELGREG